jgi:hypothetical protein
VTKQKLDRGLVNEMVSFYNLTEETDLERKLLRETSPRVRERGYLEPFEFFEICEWKSTRTKTLVRRNTPDQVTEVSRIAFSCSEDLSPSVLCLLVGVRIPTASAILSIWDPRRFTVYDVRVCDALPTLDHALLTVDSISKAISSYRVYVELTRAVAKSLGISLRDLDKTLWTWDKLGSLGLTQPRSIVNKD